MSAVTYAAPITQFIAKVAGALPNDIDVTGNVLTITFPATDATRRDVDRIRAELHRMYSHRYDRIAIKFSGADPT